MKKKERQGGTLPVCQNTERGMEKETKKKMTERSANGVPRGEADVIHAPEASCLSILS